jgi:peptide/nickel transport system permease protein
MTAVAERLAGQPESGTEPLLEVRDLTTGIRTARGTIAAVEGVSFFVGRGEVLGIVGESGSGKSLTVLSILGLVSPPVVIERGEILFKGLDLMKLPSRGWRNIRGKEISMIFQEPLTSLDSAFTIGHQLVETVRAHRRVGRREAERRALEMLERVGIGSAARRLRAYPHELSGGMRQRVMIAMSLLLEPQLLLADEPVTALDVTTQAQILDLIVDLQREMHMSVIFISHDLGVVLDVADRVAVMYAGQLVEVANAQALFRRPLHPYTHGLLRSKLSLIEKGDRVAVMPGQIPGLHDRPQVCRFAGRCPNRIEQCVSEMPQLEPRPGEDRLLRCFNPMEASAR